MKLPVHLNPNGGKGRGRIAFQGGAYSLAISAIVLALLVVVNVLVSILPTNLTRFDISSSQLYSITSNTKSVVNALEEDVTIYWIVQADQEDPIVENLLNKYDSLSEHISVEKKNPDVYPTFAQQYTDETVDNNSFIVVCGDKSRFISINDIYLYETDFYSYGYTSASFDGEGAITSAIDYVVSDELPQLYLLEGHGEAELPQTFQEQLEKDNIETQTLSLLTVDTIPEDADCLMIYSPSSDLSQEEVDMLRDYMAGGGKLLVMAGPVEDSSLDNLYSLLEDYGVTTEEGMVVEADRNHYAFQIPLALMPDMAQSDITQPLIDENYYPIVPVATGLTVSGSASGATVTELLTTSDSSFSKVAGYEMTTYDKEEGDMDGPFAVAVSVELDEGGEMVWFSSSLFLDDGYNAYSSGANVNLTMNALSQLIGEREAMSIRSKSLNYNYLTINESTASLLKVTMIGVFPLGDFSTMDSQRYVSIGDGNVYLVQEDPLDAFDVELSDLIDNDSLPYVGTADQISIQGEDSLQITWQEESSSYREEDHYFASVDGAAQPLDTSLVEDFLYTLGSLDLTDYMTYNAGEDDLATYGLDDPERTIQLDYTTEDEDGNETAHTVSLAVSRAPAERWDDTQADAETETGEEEEVTAYARVDNSPIIYKITTEEYRALMDASYDTLRHKEILPADLENVAQVDVTLDDTSYTVTASGEGEERTWSYGEQELETSDLPDALQALTADRFTEEESTGQEEIAFTLHLSLEGEPTVSIRFYRYDGTYCLAVVDGQPIALVSRSQVVDLQEAVYAVVLGES